LLINSDFIVFMNKPQAKSYIYQIAPYKQGKSASNPDVRPIKLSSNESPYGASPKAIEAYHNASKILHRYPEGSCKLLRQKLAELHAINADNIICGAGSDELIALLINAYCGVGDEVLFTEHAFLMYRVYSLSAGATPVEVAETNLKADIANIIAGITERTKIIFIANPNNPTGSYLTAQELAELHAKIPSNVILAVDSAYAECANATDYDDGLELAKTQDNVIMLRTFSKIYGLPLLRLGWAYGAPAIIDSMSRIKSPFNVNGAAQVAGLAALEDDEWNIAQQQHNAQARAYLTHELQTMGLHVYPSQANFILVDFGDEQRAKMVATALEAKHIYVREVAAYKLPKCLRISMGTVEENEIFLASLRDIIINS
jgi:histidinol-phosphate aminotransferase